MPGRPSPAPARDAVLDALRRGHDTVLAIAADLGVTDNAVRVHLAALERDRMVVRRPVVRSGKPGQPAMAYALTEAGETALSRAYQPAFDAVVAALASRLDGRTARALFAGAGARLAEGEATSGNLTRRAERAAELLRTLGGSVTLESAPREAVLVGAGCPLASAVRRAPATCTLIEALLEKGVGVRATQECHHGEHPACRFRLTASPA